MPTWRPIQIAEVRARYDDPAVALAWLIPITPLVASPLPLS